jgi:hypothetical protein
MVENTSGNELPDFSLRHPFGEFHLLMLCPGSSIFVNSDTIYNDFMIA